MKNIFKQAVIVLLIAAMAVMSVGCYGSFTLTKKVYNWNGSMGDKWTKELVFLVCVVVPVYEIAGTIDVLILNSIEFWTGQNPMNASAVTGDGTSVAFNQKTKEMTISYAGKSFVIANENGRATVKQQDGTVIAYVETGADGSLMLKDASGAVLTSYTQAEFDALLASR
ncbi:MAG: DUF3332 family protein [Bacteroidetes bacterium]|nr:MAG: DUF3332 family protein [Bacteroidota bacterium]